MSEEEMIDVLAERMKRKVRDFADQHPNPSVRDLKDEIGQFYKRPESYLKHLRDSGVGYDGKISSRNYVFAITRPRPTARMRPIDMMVESLDLTLD